MAGTLSNALEEPFPVTQENIAGASLWCATGSFESKV